MRTLLAANLLLAALLGLHVADHTVRQHTPAPAALRIPGTAGAVVVVVSLGLALARRREAAFVAAVVGAATAAGFVAIHLLPSWGPFSEPYYERPEDAVSWASMLATLGAALLLTVVALRELRVHRPRLA